MATILFVDDDLPLRRTVELILRDLGGHEVRAVSLASEALGELATSTPDLVILDYHLPDLDGLMLFREARRSGYIGPVLMLTGTTPGDPSLEQALTEIGPEALVFKPFDLDDFSAQVQAVLNAEEPA